jgi:hypothetical protein
VSGMPKVRGYPKCSACESPYVLRLVCVISPKPGEEWLWQRDCKHKKAPPVAVEAEPARDRSEPAPKNPNENHD